MEVKVIKADSVHDSNLKLKRVKKLRVAAYCRVSTDDVDQLKSYESMVRYYTDLIKSNSEWIFVGVYADRAITGTKVDKREEFQRLIQACIDGEIDLVIAKSIPRFARNTLDTLKYVRLLKEYGVAIYFEVEKINTLKDSEFLTTILSSIAQQEVENTSAYVKKGLKMKMSRGELVGSQGCLGYDYDRTTKELSINEEGAKIVRYIFDRYVAGAGSTVIARELNEMGSRTLRGNIWTSSTVIGIINNEKYMGDILLGKTFTVDPLSKRRLENRGEEDKFYIENHHLPIISKEMFQRAQEIRCRRSAGKKAESSSTGKREKFSRQYAFSCMLECGFCGTGLSRRSWHSKSIYQKTMWQCEKSTRLGKRYCPDSKGIPEKVIEDAFVEAYRELYNVDKSIVEDFLERVEKTLKEDTTEEKLAKLKHKEQNIRYKKEKLLEKFLENAISQPVYEVKNEEYEEKLCSVRNIIRETKEKHEKEVSLKRRLEDFKKALSKNSVLEKFDRGIFESMIEKVIVGGYDEDGVKDPYKITFIFKIGFKKALNHTKEMFPVPRVRRQGATQLCSNSDGESKSMCCNSSDNTCGDGCLAFPQKARRTYQRKS